MCVGALIGGGLELAVQLSDSKNRAAYGQAISALAHGDVSGAAHAAGGLVLKVGVSAAAGALGGGLNANIAKLATTTVGRGLAVAQGQAIISVADNRLKNVIDGKPASDHEGLAMAAGAIAGPLARVTGEIAGDSVRQISGSSSNGVTNAIASTASKAASATVNVLKKLGVNEEKKQ